MNVKFICEDSYEAEKLSSIFTLQKDNSLFVIGIVKVIENESIVKLKDGLITVFYSRIEIMLNVKKDFHRNIINQK